MATELTYSSGLTRLVQVVRKADMFTILFGKLGLSDFVVIIHDLLFLPIPTTESRVS